VSAACAFQQAARRGTGGLTNSEERRLERTVAPTGYRSIERQTSLFGTVCDVLNGRLDCGDNKSTSDNSLLPDRSRRASLFSRVSSETWCAPCHEWPNLPGLVWYPRGSSSRADLRAGGEDRPTLPLEGFHRKRGVCVRRVRLDVQLDLNVQLEALVYNLSSVLVTTTAFSSPPGFVRIDASLLSTLSSESTDSTPCRFHRKSGVPVLNFAICSLSRCSFSHVCLVVRSASAGIQRLLFTGNVVSPFVLLYFNILLVRSSVV